MAFCPRSCRLAAVLLGLFLPGATRDAYAASWTFQGNVKSLGSQSTNPISLDAPGDQAFLVLYGAGLRHASSVTATVNGANLPVLYFGPQGPYDGLDQINLGPLPANLAGAGAVNLIIAVDGQAANTVTLNIR